MEKLFHLFGTGFSLEEPMIDGLAAVWLTVCRLLEEASPSTAVEQESFRLKPEHRRHKAEVVELDEMQWFHKACSRGTA